MFNHKIKILKSCLVLTVVFVFFSAGFTQNPKQLTSSNQKYPQVSIPDTEVRILHSNIVNKDFEIYIKLPTSYSKSDTTYPVIYITDANLLFTLYERISRIMELPNPEIRIPEKIIVGIGYQAKSLNDFLMLRMRDLIPAPGYESEKDTVVLQLGGAQKFLDFIRKELIPFIESNYRVSATDRELDGYSLGGLFTLYTIFHYPETFKKYFAGSPAVTNVLFRYEEEYTKTHKDLPIKLFMTVGGLEYKEMIEDMQKMADRLRSRNYRGLELETHIFENENHRSCMGAAISRNLRGIYK
jgi:predicted alpha/beta superfamily hydrolase